MRTIESLQLLFNKLQTVTGPSNSCIVKEHDDGATFKQLEIVALTPNLYQCDTNFIADKKCVTENASSYLKDSNCDSTIFVYDNDNNEHILFVELKSGFDAEHLRKAFGQVVHSFYKYHMLMSVCEGYNALSNNVEFVLACHAKNTASEAEALDAVLIEQELAGEEVIKNFVSDILPELLLHPIEGISIQLGKLKIAYNHPLFYVLKEKNIRLRLVTSATPVDDKATLSLDY